MVIIGEKAASLFLVGMLAAPILGVQTAEVSGLAIDHAIVTEVYYDTYLSGEADEFVRVHNPTTEPLALAGWSLSDGEGMLTFPAGATLPAGASLYVTAKATEFRKDMIVNPTFEFTESDATIPNVVKTGSYTLSNSGDEVFLKNAEGVLIDAVAYGSSTYAGLGWTGASAASVSEGFILHRHRDEATGYFADTDAATDFVDARRYRAGQSHFPLQSFSFTGSVTTYTSPDSSYATIVSVFENATTSIDLNIYEFLNAHVGDALVERATAGVSVRVLVEGGPAGLSRADRLQQNWILDALEDAGADVRFIVTNDSQRVHARYNFDHAKYAIVDGERVLVMSGNFKTTGVPVDPTTGNREWGIVVHDESVASYLQAVFDDDFSSIHRDILPFGTGTDWRYLAPPADFVPDRAVPTGTYEHPYPARTITGDFTVTPILVPDTSLLEAAGILDRMRNAQSEIIIEQMYAHAHWGTSDAPTPNAYLEAAIEAARTNGAYVYVLLGDEFINEEDTRNNYETRDYVNGLRQTEGIPVYARIVDHRIANLTKIHNKGVVIDNATALVSSINWGQASATLNREVALLVDNAQVASFYRDVFWYDWAPKERIPPADLALESITLTQDDLAPLPVIVPPIPDVGVPDAVPDPTRATVRVVVTNVGPNDAKKSFLVDLVIRPTWLGTELAPQTATVPPLRAGQSVTLEFPFDTQGKIGDYTFTARADIEDRVLELTEDNNVLTRTQSVLVPAPGVDLLASQQVPPPPPPTS